MYCILEEGVTSKSRQEQGAKPIAMRKNEILAQSESRLFNMVSVQSVEEIKEVRRWSILASERRTDNPINSSPLKINK
jgi:hypothetical protein